MSARALARGDADAIAGAFLPAFALGNRWHYYYAREKLARDPLFPGVLAALRDHPAAVLDIGCGIGLLAHALRRDGQAQRYLGVDIDATKIARAQRAIARAALGDAAARALDLTRGLPAHAGSIAILDVLQYLDADAQARLLDDAIARLAPGAVLVLRAALDDGGRRGRATRITDWFGHFSGWMHSTPKHYPREAELRTRFDAAGLATTCSPLYGRTPFNHWLIVAAR